MSQINPVIVGNEFVLPAPRLPVSVPAVKLSLVEGGSVPVIPVEAVSQMEVVPVTVARAPAASHFSQVIELVHHHSLIVFALLFLLVGASGIEVGGSYWSAQLLKPATGLSVKKHTIAGLNLAVPASELQAKLQSITGQPVNLTIGSQSVPISSDTIKSWLKVTPNNAQNEDYIHLDSQAMTKSLSDMANKYAVAPVNQVTINHGGTDQIILAGKNGAKLTDPGSLTAQAASLAKTVMDGKGLNFSTPLVSQPFQAVTPADFSKLLEADVTTKRLYAYQNGQLVNTFLASAGKTSTPTPLGEFHIWAKFTSQTMKGPGYVQPNVPWVNYFEHSGDAVHGVYWRSASVFGNVNTSHGCVGIPVNDAEWVFDWAPIGTTVIVHA